MAKEILLLLVCMFAVDVQCWVNVNRQLIGRVIHVESLQNRGFWVNAISQTWPEKKGISKDDILFNEESRFKVLDCSNGGGQWVCLQSLKHKNRYWESTWNNWLALKEAFYPANKNWAKWEIECHSSKMERCRIKDCRHRKYLYNYNYHYATHPYRQTDMYRVLAPIPSETYGIVTSVTNDQPNPITKTLEIHQGVSTTHTKKHELKLSLLFEISAVFQEIFTGKAGVGLDNAWTKTTSNTFDKRRTITYEVQVPGFSKLTIKQLTGHYGPFTISANIIHVDCTDLKTKKKCSKKVLKSLKRRR